MRADLFYCANTVQDSTAVTKRRQVWGTSVQLSDGGAGASSLRGTICCEYYRNSMACDVVRRVKCAWRKEVRVHKDMGVEATCCQRVLEAFLT